MNLIRLIALLFLPLAVLTACAQAAPQNTTAPDAAQSVNISPQELATELQGADPPFLLDVREPFEADIATIPGTSALIPVGDLASRVGELDPNQEIVIYCRSGNRSQQAMNILQNAGFTDVRNLSGGINGWASQVDPSMEQY